MSYDKTYKKFNNVFGGAPEEILVEFFDKIDKTKFVLDIGAPDKEGIQYSLQKKFFKLKL